MDFAYYVVRKNDMVIFDGANDMVSAINMGQQQGCACLILQACVITEVGEDQPQEMPEDNFVESEVIEENRDEWRDDIDADIIE